MNKLVKYCIILFGIWQTLTLLFIFALSFPNGEILITYPFNELIFEFIITLMILIFYCIILIIEINKEWKRK